MILPLRKVHPTSLASCCLAAVLACTATYSSQAQTVTFSLKDGEKITGHIVSEDTMQVVVSNAWSRAIVIPLPEITNRETNQVIQLPGSTTPSAPAASSPAAKKEVPPPKPEPAPPAKPPAEKPAKPVIVPPPKAEAEPSASAPPKPKGKFHGQVQIGLDAVFHTKDQQSYYGNIKLTYERPYEHHPKEFFRNTSEVHGEYQKTDGEESANRVYGSNKSDFDIGKHYYAYALVGAGYDDVRKIDSQYQVGPGIGGHLFQKSKFVLNLEGGLHYEAQFRRDTDNLETFYLRFGADSTWSIRKNLKWTANEAFYPNIEKGGQYHNNFSTGLSYGFWDNLSLNLTVNDDYNTEVAPGVDQNRFEFRSTLGVTF